VILAFVLITGNAAGKDAANKPGLDKPSSSEISDTPHNTDNETATTQIDYNSPLPDVVAALPGDDALDILWYNLGGFWTAAPNQYFEFNYGEGQKGIVFGLLATEWGVDGVLTSAVPAGTNIAKLTILVPAREASEFWSARAEELVDILVDVSDYHVDGKIKINVNLDGYGTWVQYGFAGATVEDAYNSVF
jgi:hypothetical protein